MAKQQRYLPRYLNPVEIAQEDTLTDTVTIGRRKFVAGEQVICKNNAGTFKAKIRAFYQNSAIVIRENKNETVVSFRNMTDLTGEPLKKTTRSDAASKMGYPLTSYRATPEEKKKWRLQDVAGPQPIRRY